MSVDASAELSRRVRSARGFVARVQMLTAPLLILAGQGLQSASSFVTGVLIARFASVAALGDYTLGATAVFLTASMAETLVATPFTYQILRRRARRSLKTAFGAAVIATAGLTLASGLIFGAATVALPGLRPLFPAVPVAMLASLVRETIRRRYYAYTEAGPAFLLDVSTIVLQFGIVTLLIVTGRLTAATMFYAIGLACATTSGVALLMLRREIRIASRSLIQYFRLFVRFGWWLAIGGACQIFAIQSFSWFLFLTSGSKATGAFAACLAVSSLPNPFLIGLTNYCRPALMQAFATSAWRILLRRTAWLAIAFFGPVAVFALAAILGADRVLTLVYGPDLRWASTALTWTILALIPIALGAPLQLLMLAIHQPQAVFYLHVGELVATYLVGLPLVITLGLIGAATGYLAMTTAGALVLMVCFARECRRRASQH